MRIVGEITDWVGHRPKLRAMRDGLADLERRGLAVIFNDGSVLIVLGPK